jgi:hypothetical protein
MPNVEFERVWVTTVQALVSWLYWIVLIDEWMESQQRMSVNRDMIHHIISMWRG